MRHIKSFNESVRDMMKPKSTEDITKAIEKLPPYKALATAHKYQLPEVVKVCEEKIKPINAKLYRDTKKFNKNNLWEFLEFINTWVDAQGSSSYEMELESRFNDITRSLGNILEEGEEWEDDEGNHGIEEDSVEESIFSKKTIDSYKQLVINYVIDQLSHNIFESEEEYDEEDYEEDPDAEGYDYDNVPADHVTDEQLRREQERRRKEKEEEDKKKPINKIKNFLGFNKKEK